MDNIFDGITENLFYVVRLIHKKLLKVDLSRVSEDISRPHLAIMGLLNERDSLPVSEIGKRLLIPKSQMTYLVDKLIALGMVARLPDEQDRRIINLRLTGPGKEALAECRQLVTDNIRKELSSLGETQLIELSDLLKKLRDFGERLE